VIRHRGNSWTVSVYVGLDPLTGRERRVTRTVRGKPGQQRPPKEARDLEARLLVEAGNGEHREARVTVAELLARWIEHTGPDLSPKTLHEYQGCVDRMIVPRIGTVRIDKLTPAMLDRLYRTLRDEGGRNGTPLAPATIRQVHAILRRSLVHAERWGWINRNPATLASPPKVHRREIVPPSPEQMRRILAAARDDSPDLGVAVWLAAITGARRGELCGLRWSDLEDESFVIRRSVASLSGRIVVKTPKTHRARHVALDDETLRLLRAHRIARAEIVLALGLRLEDDAYVLSDHPSAAEPLRPDTFTDRFRRLARRLGLACRLHDLRHWHVTQALGAGLPVRDVAERVGDASARMTLDVYGHAIVGADRRAAEVVAGVLTDAPPRASSRRRPSTTRRSAATSEATLFDTER